MSYILQANNGLLFSSASNHITVNSSFNPSKKNSQTPTHGSNYEIFTVAAPPYLVVCTSGACMVCAKKLEEVHNIVYVGSNHLL